MKNLNVCLKFVLKEGDGYKGLFWCNTKDNTKMRHSSQIKMAHRDGDEYDAPIGQIRGSYNSINGRKKYLNRKVEYVGEQHASEFGDAVRNIGKFENRSNTRGMMQTDDTFRDEFAF